MGLEQAYGEKIQFLELSAAARERLLARSDGPHVSEEGYVEFLKRYEAALFAQGKLDDVSEDMDLDAREDMEWIRDDGFLAFAHMERACERIVIEVAIALARPNTNLEDLFSLGCIVASPFLQRWDYTKDISFASNFRLKVHEILDAYILQTPLYAYLLSEFIEEEEEEE